MESSAPKERINIVFKSSNHGGNEGIELPLRLLTLGRFSSAGRDETAIDKKTIHQVNKENFDRVMQKVGVQLTLEVSNKLAGEADSLKMNLDFKAIKDFSPETIVTQVPELAKLITLRRALLTLKGPMGNLPDFRKKLREILSEEEVRNRLVEELSKD